jgi:hypothetical protein
MPTLPQDGHNVNVRPKSATEGDRPIRLSESIRAWLERLPEGPRRAVLRGMAEG